MPVSEVFNEDNIFGLYRYPDNFFDLAVLDPQTGQGEDKSHAHRDRNVLQKNGLNLRVKVNHTVKDWDKEAPSQHFWDQLFRVSKHQIIMCENYLNFNQKASSQGRIVWNLLRDNDFSDCQIMWTSLTSKIEYFEYMWNGMLQGSGINSRLQKGNKKLNEERIHPSQKPAIVYDYLFSKYARNGFKIIDTHMGSQNSRIAAYKRGLDYYGWEKDEQYFKEGCERFNNSISEPLFDVVKQPIQTALL